MRWNGKQGTLAFITPTSIRYFQANISRGAKIPLKETSMTLNWYVRSAEQTCRLCLRYQVGSILIFNQEEGLRSRILDCCPITLHEDDRLPKAICKECEEKVNATYAFREQCRQSENTLRLSYALPSISTEFEIVGVETGRGAEEGGEEDSGKTEEVKDARWLGQTGERVSRSEGREKVAIAKEGRRYLCDACKKTFASKSGLRFHLKTHNGTKAHPCRYCDKSFVIASYARRHEKIHTGEKRFACQFCSAAFASSNGLKYHLRLHTGEANYRCETCGKSFRRCKYLKEHSFTHTGEKPFVCKWCNVAYGNSGSLFAHEKKCRTN